MLTFFIFFSIIYIEKLRGKNNEYKEWNVG